MEKARWTFRGTVDRVSRIIGEPSNAFLNGLIRTNPNRWQDKPIVTPKWPAKGAGKGRLTYFNYENLLHIAVMKYLKEGKVSRKYSDIIGSSMKKFSLLAHWILKDQTAETGISKKVSYKKVKGGSLETETTENWTTQDWNLHSHLHPFDELYLKHEDHVSRFNMDNFNWLIDLFPLPNDEVIFRYTAVYDLWVKNPRIICQTDSKKFKSANDWDDQLKMREYCNDSPLHISLDWNVLIKKLRKGMAMYS